MRETLDLQSFEAKRSFNRAFWQVEKPSNGCSLSDVRFELKNVNYDRL